MAKRKIKEATATPPTLVWYETSEGWIPEVILADIVFPLEARPFKGFYHKERDAILTFIKMALSEILFDHPCYIVNDKTGKFVVNPDWNLLEYYQKNDKGDFIKVEPSPSLAQLNVDECPTL